MSENDLWEEGEIRRGRGDEFSRRRFSTQRWNLDKKNNYCQYCGSKYKLSFSDFNMVFGLRVYLFNFVPPILAFLNAGAHTFQIVVLIGATFAIVGAILALQRRCYIEAITITALSLCFGGNFLVLFGLVFLTIGKKEFGRR